MLFFSSFAFCLLTYYPARIIVVITDYFSFYPIFFGIYKWFKIGYNSFVGMKFSLGFTETAAVLMTSVIF